MWSRPAQRGVGRGRGPVQTQHGVGHECMQGQHGGGHGRVQSQREVGRGRVQGQHGGGHDRLQTQRGVGRGHVQVHHGVDAVVSRPNVGWAWTRPAHMG